MLAIYWKLVLQGRIQDDPLGPPPPLDPPLCCTNLLSNMGPRPHVTYEMQETLVSHTKFCVD